MSTGNPTYFIGSRRSGKDRRRSGTGQLLWRIGMIFIDAAIWLNVAHVALQAVHS